MSADSPSPTEKSNRGFQVAGWSVDPAACRIARDKEEIRLEPKVMQVLQYLAARQGQVVSRQDLEDSVWAGTVIGYEALGNTIIKLRKAFGDDARHPRIIETISKNGYRLLAEVIPVNSEGEVPSRQAGPVVAYPDEPNRVVRWHAHRLTPALAVMSLLIVCAGVFAWWRLLAPEFVPATVMNRAYLDGPAIAVLPFDNLSGDREQEYFSDGVTNDIITDLSKFHSLFVIASDSVVAYKGKPVKAQEVGRELGVRYVLGGSVQRMGEALRINAQLIDASTGGYLWAERYHRDLQHLFAVQEEIVQAIVATLAFKLTRLELERTFAKGTDNLDAYDYSLRGREYLARTTRPTNVEARQMFQRAIELDPRYAAAYVGLGWTYRNAAGHGWTEFPGEALQQAEALAQKALSLEESAGAYRLLGYVYLFREQYDLATRASERAMALNPNDWDSQAILGSVMFYSGRRDEAIRAYERALRFNPGMDIDRLIEFALAYYLERRYDDAIRTLEQRVGRNPDLPFLYVALTAAYAEAGRLEDATRAAVKVRRLDPFFEVAPFGTRFRNPQDRERIAEGLRKAGLK